MLGGRRCCPIYDRFVADVRGNRLDQSCAIDRFYDVVVATGIEAFLAIRGHRMRRQGDDRAGVAVLA